MWKKTFVGRVLVGKCVEKRPLGRPRHSWDDNTKMYLKEIGCDHKMSGLIWPGLVKWLAAVNIAMNFFFLICCGAFLD